MPAERVLDASIVGALFFNEQGGAELARTVLDRRLIAPEFLLVEAAGIGAKKERRGEPKIELAEIMEGVRGLIDGDLTPTLELLPAAHAIARRSRISLYDALYVALAQGSGCSVLTLDKRLSEAAEEIGLGALVDLVER